MDRRELRAMIEVDERHWWYRGRRRIIRAQLDRLRIPSHASILDAGCGSGRTLDDLARYGAVSGIDVSPEAVAAARDRGHEDVLVGRLEDLPWPDESFTVVTCLDVLEHTRDDRVTLDELRRVTRRDGYALITVPAYPALWSHHDVVNRHYRRYVRGTLRAAARDTGWRVKTLTSFNTVLLGPAAAIRIAQRWAYRGRATTNRPSDLTIGPRWLNRPLELPLRAEAAFMRRGACLPVGLSLLAVLVRRPTVDG